MGLATDLKHRLIGPASNPLIFRHKKKERQGGRPCPSELDWMKLPYEARRALPGTQVKPVILMAIRISVAAPSGTCESLRRFQ